jgi:tetratricopeptide (TPR) repeat protein
MPVFALAVFSGAFLLFQVQPMIGKFILPWFGGGPGVWTTCMLFFQLVLLGGYAYAHLLCRWFKPRAQVVVHLALLAAALALLPITPSDSWKPQGAGDPRLQIMALLGACLGLPYFVLSATGPLIQEWFSRARPGVSPYRLYALSNTGSLLALVSYPIYFETHFTRRTQAELWAWGLVAFVVFCGLCAVRVWKCGEAPNEQRSEVRDQSTDGKGPNEGATSDGLPPALRDGEGEEPGRAGKPSGVTRLLWLLLPACASVLLLATTNKICQDVTVIPLLWIVPLSLYLLSFIICFDSPRWYRRGPFALALGVAEASICWALFGGNAVSIPLQLAAYSAGLFVCCMVCHGELYRLRPDPTHLTAFYLMIAAGGALGGVFVTLVAPLIFTDYYELHWGLVFCAVLFLIAWLRDSNGGERLAKWRWAVCGSSGAAIVALAVALWLQAHQSGKLAVARSRNFYGVLSVRREDPSSSGLYCLTLRHGITTHGLQLVDPALAALPTAYFGENSGIGRTLHSMPGDHRRIGVIGLGVGTLATYAKAGDYVHMYEINPEVERLARSYFTYLGRCAGELEVTLGDGRLSLEREPPQNFDLLMMDAFSSDAIPMHLLTREAFALYQRHLKTNGVIVVQISNRHLDLEPVVANVAAEFNYRAVVIEDREPRDTWWLYRSVEMVLSRNDEFMDSPLIAGAGKPARMDSASVPLWTDDFASLYPIIRWKSGPGMETLPVETQVGIACDLTQRGDFAGAIARYRMALKMDPDFPEALNNLAWLLASCPDASLRDGAEAVRLGERACKITDYNRTMMLGTLAAAYAEAGRFPDAVAMAQKACALASGAGDEVLAQKNQQLLELYRAGKAYHEPAGGEAGK